MSRPLTPERRLAREHWWAGVTSPTGVILARRQTASRAAGVAVLRDAMDFDGEELARLTAGEIVPTILGHFAPHVTCQVAHCYCHAAYQHDTGGPAIRDRPPGAHYRLAMRYGVVQGLLRDDRYASATAVTQACFGAGLPQPSVHELWVCGAVLGPWGGRRGPSRWFLSWCTCTAEPAHAYAVG